MRRKRNAIAGIILVLLGFSLLGGIVRRGAAMRMAANQANMAQMEASESVEATNREYTARAHAHGFGEHGRFGGPAGFFFIIPRLLLLGLGGLLLLKFLRRRQHGGPTGYHGRAADNVEDEITLDPDAAAGPAPSADEMSVDDLLQAMKRLGIKKLEL